jgi:hypothetical protein
MTDSQINGLILIDCWEPDEYYPPSKLSKRQGKAKQIFYKNLVENLKSFNFAGIIDAGTHQIKTAVQVQDYLSTQSNVFVLAKQLDFFKLRKHKPWKNIHHWLVVGTTWQVCVHLNNMGLCSFSTMIRQHPKLNFYGVPWGFLKHDLTATTAEDFATDLLTWTNVGQMYRLHPEIIDQSTQFTQTSKFRDKYIDATPY